MKAFEWQTVAKAGNVIKVALFSDTHADSPHCDLEKLKADMTYCKKDGRFMR